MKAKVLPMSGYEALNLKQATYQKLTSNTELQRRTLARKMHALFVQNELGQEMLEVLKEWTLVRPVSPPGCQTGYAHFREGQNDVIRSILEAIEEAENE